MTDPLDSLRRPVQPIEPDEDFADTLRDRLRRAVLNERAEPEPTEGTAMTTTEAPARAESHSLGAYLAVTDARAALDFYVEAFGAARRADPIVMDDGRIGHAEVAIGDSVLMLAEPFPEIGHTVAPSGGPSIRVEVADVPDAVTRAERLGATVNYPARDEGHGMQANITDPYGQRWILAQAARRSTEGTAGAATPRHGEVGYFTFTVPDDEAAKAFYGAVLGWQFSPGHVERGWGAEGTGLPDAGVWGGQAYAGWKLMYAVDDLDAAVARVRANGGQANDPTTEPYGRTADCVDNQGVEFWLWQG